MYCKPNNGRFVSQITHANKHVILLHMRVLTSEAHRGLMNIHVHTHWFYFYLPCTFTYTCSYSEYWRSRLATEPITNFAPVFRTNTLPTGKAHDIIFVLH